MQYTFDEALQETLRRAGALKKRRARGQRGTQYAFQYSIHIIFLPAGLKTRLHLLRSNVRADCRRLSDETPDHRRGEPAFHNYSIFQ